MSRVRGSRIGACTAIGLCDVSRVRVGGVRSVIRICPECDASLREGEIVESTYFSKDGHGYCPHCGGVLL